MTFGCEKTYPKSSEFFDLEVKIDKWPNGNIKSKLYFRNNMQDSIGIWYYKSGKINSIVKYNNGAIEGESLEYTENGILKYYRFYNQASELIYLIEYSEKDNSIKKEVGKPHYVLFDNEDEEVEVNKDFAFVVFHAIPPKTKTSLYVGHMNKRKFLPTDKYELRDKIPYFKFNFGSIGINSVYIISEIKDTLRNSEFRDTSYMNIEVIPQKN